MKGLRNKRCGNGTDKILRWQPRKDKCDDTSAEKVSDEPIFNVVLK